MAAAHPVDKRKKKKKGGSGRPRKGRGRGGRSGVLKEPFRRPKSSVLIFMEYVCLGFRVQGLRGNKKKKSSSAPPKKSLTLFLGEEKTKMSGREGGQTKKRNIPVCVVCVWGVRGVCVVCVECVWSVGFSRFHSMRRVLRSQSRVDTHGQ